MSHLIDRRDGRNDAVVCLSVYRSLFIHKTRLAPRYPRRLGFSSVPSRGLKCRELTSRGGGFQQHTHFVRRFVDVAEPALQGFGLNFSRGQTYALWQARQRMYSL